MERTVKKLYRGLVEVRDYDVQSAIDKDEGFRINYDGESMVLSPYELINKLIRKSEIFRSKVGQQDYRLYAYKWQPNID